MSKNGRIAARGPQQSCPAGGGRGVAAGGREHVKMSAGRAKDALWQGWDRAHGEKAADVCTGAVVARGPGRRRRDREKATSGTGVPARHAGGKGPLTWGGQAGMGQAGRAVRSRKRRSRAGKRP